MGGAVRPCSTSFESGAPSASSGSIEDFEPPLVICDPGHRISRRLGIASTTKADHQEYHPSRDSRPVFLIDPDGRLVSTVLPRDGAPDFPHLLRMLDALVVLRGHDPVLGPMSTSAYSVSFSYNSKKTPGAPAGSTDEGTKQAGILLPTVEENNIHNADDAPVPAVGRLVERCRSRIANTHTESSTTAIQNNKGDEGDINILKSRGIGIMLQREEALVAPTGGGKSDEEVSAKLPISASEDELERTIEIPSSTCSACASNLFCKSNVSFTGKTGGGRESSGIASTREDHMKLWSDETGTSHPAPVLLLPDDRRHCPSSAKRRVDSGPVREDDTTEVLACFGNAEANPVDALYTVRSEGQVVNAGNYPKWQGFVRANSPCSTYETNIDTIKSSEDYRDFCEFELNPVPAASFATSSEGVKRELSEISTSTQERSEAQIFAAEREKEWQELMDYVLNGT
ncbi:unnamed protein product [Amoebophrya sp. A25]|nr:unnamed protein product [Amoebophrya sp. A25]|eukprot:GSA25T00007261001.1